VKTAEVNDIAQVTGNITGPFAPRDCVALAIFEWLGSDFFVYAGAGKNPVQIKNWKSP
jgi:hypothetical protein